MGYRMISDVIPILLIGFNRLHLKKNDHVFGFSLYHMVEEGS
jgi:hypothetical protein